MVGENGSNKYGVGKLRRRKLVPCGDIDESENVGLPESEERGKKLTTKQVTTKKGLLSVRKEDTRAP